MSQAMRFSTLIIFALGLTACGSKEKSPERPALVEESDAAPVEVSGMRFEIEPSDAEVIVDGKTLGKASELMGRGMLDLEPGIHQIMIRHEGFETARVEVTITGTTETLQLSLKSRSP
jgi:hypothetical protein